MEHLTKYPNLEMAVYFISISECIFSSFCKAMFLDHPFPDYLIFSS